ncbi:hypothetical protein [Enterococcus gilvus]|uniref:Uncharacterized protein n=1 Tax=Enterococcus gilvus ATCC BAA-350 TaxID=1158614 RepID=R2XNE6_9ENTE|nr:hypothetical protein [Enterococcus gilvus]EOI51502.1 hypothetical protein UKC_04177 [Enterococcus gilvus ATCC BAA-350]EOW77187.1 hypothetical protein I592_04163 [Enterococcus gilvus ATCC BAA-350]
MAFSTKQYYVKPVIPTVRPEINFSGITLLSFDAKPALLLSEDFRYSSHFYIENDLLFKTKFYQYFYSLKSYLNNLVSKGARQNIRGISTSCKFEDHYRELEQTIKSFREFLLKPDMYIYEDSINKEKSHTSEATTSKELHYWLKKTFKYRKKMINSIYPKQQYLEFHSLLNECNIFLKMLGENSLHFTDSLDLFFDIGSSVDWFLLNITECPYHEANDFKKLFSSNVRVNNDLVTIAGIFNIMKQPSAFELYLADEKPFFEKIEQYKGIFRDLLTSGNRVIDLETLKLKAQKEVETITKQSTETSEWEEKLQEIQSMHDVAVERKIHDIK